MVCTGAEVEQVRVRFRELWARAPRWGMRQRRGQEPGKAFIQGLDFVLKGMGNTGREMLKFLSFSKQSIPCPILSADHGILHLPNTQIRSATSRTVSPPAARRTSPTLGPHAALAPPRSGTCIFSLYQPVTSLGEETGPHRLRPEISCASCHS